MSVITNNVSSASSSPTPNSLLPPSSATAFWGSRLVTNGLCGLTTVETKRLCSRLLAGGLVLGGASAIGVAVAGIAPSAVAFLALPAIVLAAGSIWYSITLNEYENPEELEKFKNEAARLPSLDQVFEAYGINNVLHFGILSAESFAEKYRQQMRGKTLVEILTTYEQTQHKIAQCSAPRFNYVVPHPREWAHLWRTETATKTFEEIMRIYSFDQLERYRILEEGELNTLKELMRRFDIVRWSFTFKEAIAEGDFHNHISDAKRDYDETCSRADRNYQNNFAVLELQGIEQQYARERQRVQEQKNQMNQEAKWVFDRAVATLTANGQFPLAQLSMANKRAYAQEQQKLQQAYAQADSMARESIQQLDRHRADRLTYLEQEKNRAKEENQAIKSQAKIMYDIQIANPSAQKERVLAPAREAYRSALADLDALYRAYLRSIRVHN